MAEKNTFVMYMDWGAMFETLDAEKAGTLIKAVYAYQKGEEPEIEDNAVSAMFAYMKLMLDKDTKKYEDKCAKNKQIAEDRERAKKSTNVHERTRTCTTANESAPNSTDNDNDNDTDNDTDNGNDNVNVFEKPTVSKNKTLTLTSRSKVTAEDVDDVLAYFNDKVGSHFRGPSSREKIRARLEEGFSIEEAKTVIRKKAKAWKNDEAMAKYLRPETIFSKSKFEGYLNEPEPHPKTSILEQTLAWGGVT